MEPCRGGDLLEPTGVGGLCGVVWTYPFVSWMCLQVVNKSRVARMVTCPSSSKWVCLKQSTFNWNDLCLYWWTFGGYTQFSDKATWLFAAAGFACRQHLRKERRNSSGAWKEIHSLHFDLCWLHLADFEHWRHDDFQRFPHSTHHSTHHLMHLCLTQKKTEPRTDHTYWRHGEESEEPRSNWPRRGLRCCWDRGWWRFESHGLEVLDFLLQVMKWADYGRPKLRQHLSPRCCFAQHLHYM